MADETASSKPRHRSRSRSPSRRDSRREPRRSRSRSPRRRSPYRDSDEGRRRHGGDRDRPKKRTGGFKWKDQQRNEGDRDDSRLQRGYRDREKRRSPPTQPSERRTEDTTSSRPTDKKFEPPAAPAPAPAPPGQTMIIVHVNDRLGTKAAIPCLPSDPIKLFKAQVAARIGRDPHEIMLKRQGERPFKDALTLEDYGVSNGVQLDLELDTGD